MHEIERKFLVTKPLAMIVGDTIGNTVEQCYLRQTGDWTIRVRRMTVPADGLIAPYVECTQTLKRKITDMKCIELETEIDEDYFDHVRSLSDAMLEKTRYVIHHGNHWWEVDHFTQAVFNGLIVAEIELKDEREVFELPDWAGEEVTLDKQYKNARMVKRLQA